MKEKQFVNLSASIYIFIKISNIYNKSYYDGYNLLFIIMLKLLLSKLMIDFYLLLNGVKPEEYELALVSFMKS